MAKAIGENVVVAESDRTVEIEGNQYFPADSVHLEYLRPSEHHTVCPWKGTASYYHLEAGGKRNENAAWYYPNPKTAAAEIKDHIAFWKGVKVQK